MKMFSLYLFWVCLKGTDSKKEQSKEKSTNKNDSNDNYN